MIPHDTRLVTILLADDDTDGCALTREAFEKINRANDLRGLVDVAELLDYLFRRGKYADPATSPRPVLLDLNMPRIDGPEAADRQLVDNAERGS
jgi:CheY-like chemotaxis protein